MILDELKNRFIDIYGECGEEIRFFSSPGRVNLIGEHTDYNGGYVFPVAVGLSTIVAARKRNDRQINLAATDLDIRVKASLDELDRYKNLDWGHYQLGVADELLKAGYDLIGCDLLYHGTIPYGAGLSSSASIEVATALTLATFANEAKGINTCVDLVEMAKIGQRAENNYVGVNCGIMDQFASAMGKKDHAIFLNCRDLSFKHVPLHMKGYKIVISNTNKKRSLGASKYNERRSECEKGFEILHEKIPEATCLGEISYEQFNEYKHLIENKTIRNRVEHVISEDDRVLKSVKALNNGNIEEFGRLMIESHNSLRDLYEVTGNELDTLVEEALKIDGVAGSRMTGAGFGGCTVSIVRDDVVDEFKEKVGKNYYERIGLNATFYVCEAGDGAREIGK